MVPSPVAAEYDFGDFRSETLVTKAWGALARGDTEAVLAYTNKVLELYTGEAQKMQAALTSYPQGKKEEVFAYWAINDVATALFIQGEAYRKANMQDEAKQVYQKIVDEYSYGQCWDPQGWFWKPADAAKEKIAMITTGSTIDFGDYSSSTLTAKAWTALNGNDSKSAVAYVDKLVELYSDRAKEMQSALTEYPWESKEKIFAYWALNDVGTGLFIKAEALKKEGKSKEAQAAYKQVVDEFSYAQCWDPQGWFWKPKEAAQEALMELGEI
jgi:tetratricopeptide (TPR) repeat protein